MVVDVMQYDSSIKIVAQLVYCAESACLTFDEHPRKFNCLPYTQGSTPTVASKFGKNPTVDTSLKGTDACPYDKNLGCFVSMKCCFQYGSCNLAWLFPVMWKLLSLVL